MNKRLYIQPTVKTRHITPSSMICGSGSETGTLPGGSTGKEPIPSGGVITGEAKSAFEFDSYEEE